MFGHLNIGDVANALSNFCALSVMLFANAFSIFCLKHPLKCCRREFAEFVAVRESSCWSLEEAAA
jgi:hypothetical protein